MLKIDSKRKWFFKGIIVICDVFKALGIPIELEQFNSLMKHACANDANQLPKASAIYNTL